MESFSHSFFVIPTQCYLWKCFYSEQEKGRKQTVSYAIKKDDPLTWNFSNKNPQIIQYNTASNYSEQFQSFLLEQFSSSAENN